MADLRDRPHPFSENRASAAHRIFEKGKPEVTDRRSKYVTAPIVQDYNRMTGQFSALWIGGRRYMPSEVIAALAVAYPDKQPVA